MDPIPNSPAFPTDLAALLGLAASGKETQLQAALLAMVGQELDFLFEATVPEGVKLRLPQGQILVAQGELPFPEGTVLRVQVLPPPPGETAPRLQTLSARLPPAHPLLAPLVEGEAYPLLQRLQAPDPPPPLRALAQLFKHLESLAPPPADQALPEFVSASLPEVPQPLREPLRQALLQLLPPESPESVIRRWLAHPPLPLRPPANPSPLPPPPAPLEGEDSPLPPHFRKLLETRGGVQDLPPEVRAPLAAALAPRLPPRPLEALVLEWAAQTQELTKPAARSPLQPTIPFPEKGTLPAPASGPATANPDLQEILPVRVPEVRLPEVPLPLREPLQALFQAIGLLPERASRPAPAPLPALLATLGPPDLQALARGLGLSRVPSAPELLQVLREPGRNLPSVPQLELAGLPESLARALAIAVAAEGGAILPPSPQVLERSLRSWPEPQRLELARFLVPPNPQAWLPKASPTPPPSPRDLAEALLRWIQNLEAEAPTPSVLPAPRPEGRNLPPALPAEALKLVNHPAIPPGLKETARTWLKALQPSPPASSLREPAPVPVLKDLPLDPAVKAGLEARLAGAAPEVLAHSEPWGGWVEASLRTLASPTASPREAPFHALQALDGTAYFEIPLPGRASGPLQIWVEQDAPGGSPEAPPVHKLLLGLRFSALGETRVGLLQSTGSLAVRIWAEHPAVLQGGENALREELESLGDQVSLRIAALPLGTPTPRSLAVGPGYQGLA